MSALTKQGKETDKIIPKSELIDGHYYIGKTFQRGMPIGQWSKFNDKFLCIHDAGFGQIEVYLMPHIENDNGLVCFGPVTEIEL